MTPLRTSLIVLLALGTLGSSCAPQADRRAERRAAPKPVESLFSRYIPWGEHSVETRVGQIGPRVRRLWKADFSRLGLAYPPAAVVLVALKRERQVEVYAGPSSYGLKMVRRVNITAASGLPGPKLREGDRQVPEGVYEIESLNPNSRFHVALRLAYPNDFDRRMAGRDHRTKLGGDIMIHGSDQSVGCIAVGDAAAEDLFVLAADTGIEKVSVVIVPRDFRRTGESEPMPGQPAWVKQLYADLQLELLSLPRAASSAATADPSSPVQK